MSEEALSRKVEPLPAEQATSQATPELPAAPLPIAAPASSRRGLLIGLALVMVWSISIVVLTYRASNRFNAMNLVETDASYWLANVGILLQSVGHWPWLQGFRTPVPFHSSELATDVYVLHNLVAWVFAPLLPVRAAVASILNGIWYVVMAISVYLLFLRYTFGAWRVAALAASGFIVASPLLPRTTYGGLSNLDPNFVGFALGTSVLCWVLLTQSLRKRWAAVVLGLLTGLLVFGRVYTLGVIVPIAVPFALVSLWRDRKQRPFQGLLRWLLAILAAVATCGWWLIPHLHLVLIYPFQFNNTSTAVLQRHTFLEGLGRWFRFLWENVLANKPLVIVLGWVFLFQVYVAIRERKWPRPHLLALWMAICPLMVFSKMGTVFPGYGPIILIGLFLFLLVPFRDAPLRAWRQPVFEVALGVAVAISGFLFLRSMQLLHDATRVSKATSLDALNLIRDDARAHGKSRASIGLIHWGVLHDAALLDLLIYDEGFRVDTADYPVHAERGSQDFVVKMMAVDIWRWNPAMFPHQALTPKRWVRHVLNNADYVIALQHDRHSREVQRPAYRFWIE
ncbi:MAG TPA: hypothetical protein VGP93_15105, partial [Polyangiaceae bacterium]|nr:hypothetical protein [Polyangiaceae bacterium]